MFTTAKAPLVALALLIVLVALGTTSHRVQAASSKPIEAYIVVPAGETLTAAMEAEARSWIPRVEAWYERESGKDITVNLNIVRPTASIEDMSRASDRDACGDGLYWPSFLIEMSDMGIGVERSDARLWFIVIGAGGWAGGLYNRQADYGWAIVGDRGLYEAATGQQHPCAGDYTCVPFSGNDFSRCANAFGHETTHSMGIDDPAHDLFLDDPWTRSIRRQFLNSNKAFYTRSR